MVSTTKLDSCTSSHSQHAEVDYYKTFLPKNKQVLLTVSPCFYTQSESHSIIHEVCLHQNTMRAPAILQQPQERCRQRANKFVTSSKKKSPAIMPSHSSLIETSGGEGLTVWARDWLCLRCFKCSACKQVHYAKYARALTVRLFAYEQVCACVRARAFFGCQLSFPLHIYTIMGYGVWHKAVGTRVLVREKSAVCV